MKKIVRYIWIVVALFLVWGCYRAVRAHSKLVTLKVDDVELREVIRKLEWQTWENILVHRDVQGRITLDVKSTPLPEVRPEVPLTEAVRLLRESGRQVVLVTTAAGMPVGALTMRDVSRIMAAA